jgi:hypothetical protein
MVTREVRRDTCGGAFSVIQRVRNPLRAQGIDRQRCIADRKPAISVPGIEVL